MSRSKHGLRETVRLAGGFIEGRRRAIGIVVAAAVFSSLAEAIVLLIVARLAFALATGRANVGVRLGPVGEVSIAMEALIAIAAGLVLVGVALQLFGASVRARLVARVGRDNRVRLTSSYLASSWALQSAERSGRLQEMVGAFVGAVSSAVQQLASGLVALASLTVFLVTALVVSVIAAVGVALAALGLALVLRPLRGATRRVSGYAAHANLVVSTDVAEAASHVLEIRAFGAERAVTERLSGRIRDAAELDAKRTFLSAISPVLYQGAGLLLIVGAVGVLYATNVSRLGAVGGVVLIMLRSLGYGQSLQTAYQALHIVAPNLEMLRDEIERYEAAAVARGGASVANIGEVTFEHVSFAYEPGVPVLRDVSFTVPHGEIVGIVGPSGAGKSTLMQLVLRFREPTTGSVLADGRDVRSLALDDWYSRVSFVPQDPVLFAGSVTENVRFYRDSIEQADVERAAKLANLHDDVTAWPDGYGTFVGQRGGQLSGGQRQRLCIARAIAEEPDLIVFDESTSSLDARSEGLVRDAMASLAPRATVFVIAHRLSTLTICDRIMVVLDGALHGFDEPKRLEATNPFYQEALELSGLR